MFFYLDWTGREVLTQSLQEGVVEREGQDYLACSLLMEGK